MKILRKIHLSIEHIWALVIIVGIFVFVNTHPIRPHDFWWHLAIGREMLSAGHIPLVDIYSYTMQGQSYASYQIYWLMEVILYLAYSIGEGALVVFIQSLLVTGTYGIVIWLGYYQSRSWRVAALVTLFAAVLGMNDWNVRPQVISFFLGALILLAIYQYRRTHRTLWLGLLPIAMIVWVNSHGTFPIGLVLISAWWLQEVWSAYREKSDRKKLLNPITLMTLAGWLVCFINPQGWKIISYLLSMVDNLVVQNMVPEWSPPSFSSLGGISFFVGLVGIASVLIASPKRPTVFQLILFVLFSLLGIKTMRGAIWFGIVLSPILAEHVAAILKHYLPERRIQQQYHGRTIINWIFVTVLFLVSVITLPWFKEFIPLPSVKAGIISSETPIEATEYLLEEQLPTPLFHDMAFGSYLIWKAQPEYKVFVDPRIELFDIDIWTEYLTISNAVGNYQANLDKYGVQTIMASRSGQGNLIDDLSKSSEWRVVYEDQVAVIFIRRK